MGMGNSNRHGYREPFRCLWQTVIVTGASYVIGVTMVELFAEAGANVVASARSKDKIDAVVASIQAAGGTAIGVACDVADSASVKAMVEHMLADGKGARPSTSLRSWV